MLKKKYVIRKLLAITLMLCSIFATIPSRCFAQQQSSVSQIKEQLNQLLLADKDPSLSVEAKELNRKFINERRFQLQALLIEKIAVLKKYQSKVENALSAEENKVIRNTISELENELTATTNEIENGNAVVGATELQVKQANRPQTTQYIPTSNVIKEIPKPEKDLSPKSTPQTTNPVTVPSPDELSKSDCSIPNVPQIISDTIKGIAKKAINDPSYDENVGELFVYVLAYSIASDETAKADDKITKMTLRNIQIAKTMVETSRTDKHIGASANASASTSLTEKPGFAELLGFAIENGAIEKEAVGTTITLSTSPYALIAAGNDTAGTYSKYGYLSRVGVSATFNVDDKNNVLTSVRRQQLDEYSIKLRLSPDRSIRSKTLQDFFDQNSKDFAKISIVITSALKKLTNSNTTLSKKISDLKTKFVLAQNNYVTQVKSSSLSDDEKQKALQQQLLCLAKLEIYDTVKSGSLSLGDKEKQILKSTIDDLVDAYDSRKQFNTNIENKIKELNRAAVYSLGFTLKRQPNASDYSTLKFMFQRETAMNLKFIANTSFSLYSNPNRMMNQQTVRDFAVAISLEGNAGKSPFLFKPEANLAPITYSFSGRYQRLLENRGMPMKKADLATAQFKLEIPLAAGMTIPLSITYANATELIKEDKVRGNFGISLDLDKLFTLTQIK